ncbi:MAG TPA: hypothetical protein VFG54_18690 [Prolixibacteraceae bacterium]|nr:hypothetical protein [Prolixibacteraceae bacterium]
MDKLDKQFEQIMKGVKIESPSKGFTMNVMERIQAEAATQKRSVIEDYQPVIGRKAWIVIIAAFIGLMAYIVLAGNETTQAPQSGIMSAIAESAQKLNTKGVSNMWESVNGMVASIPSIAYLIIIASSILWSLDIYLTRMRNAQSTIQLN